MSKKEKNVEQEYDDLPFYIHASPQYAADQYPTHSHGLAELGLPEFIFDPLAFGPEGNAFRINRSAEFFAKPDNSHLLREILEGKIVKLRMADLDPSAEDAKPYTYCYRLVDESFEAVRQAYLDGIGSLPFGMKIIQIWVEGDSIVLTDDYYVNLKKQIDSYLKSN